jgi:CRP/FNR family cyclic AMP-dependent transcriptional regulator
MIRKGTSKAMTSNDTRPGYDPRAALAFFKAAGKLENVAAGARIFAEKERGSKLLFKRNKMYLLLAGEVSLVSGRKEIGTVKPGMIFGELAAITAAPRAASAVAKAPCKVISLDDKQFLQALKKKPSFALPLMSMLIARLRDSVARLASAGALPEDATLKETAAFEPRHLAELVTGLSDDPVVYFDRGKPIVLAGQQGLRMYVVTEGSVRVLIGEQVVERLGPGGVFGEAALLEQAPRLATVVAERDCAVLPITRNAFLGLVKMSPGFAESMLSALAGRLRYLATRLQESPAP